MIARAYPISGSRKPLQIVSLWGENARGPNCGPQKWGIKMLTKVQRGVLDNADIWGEFNLAEFELEWGYRGAAVSAVIQSLERRGLLRDRKVTPEGYAALAKVTP